MDTDSTGPSGNGRQLEEGQPSTAADAELAQQRADEARQRDRQAAIAAGRRLDETAELHERVAGLYDQAAEWSERVPAGQRRHAGQHRAAAHEDRRMADAKRQEAEAE